MGIGVSIREALYTRPVSGFWKKPSCYSWIMKDTFYSIWGKNHIWIKAAKSSKAAVAMLSVALLDIRTGLGYQIISGLEYNHFSTIYIPAKDMFDNWYCVRIRVHTLWWNKIWCVVPDVIRDQSAIQVELAYSFPMGVRTQKIILYFDYCYVKW